MSNIDDAWKEWFEKDPKAAKEFQEFDKKQKETDEKEENVQKVGRQEAKKHVQTKNEGVGLDGPEDAQDEANQLGRKRFWNEYKNKKNKKK